MNNDKTRKIGQFLPLILVPLIMIMAISFFVKNSASEKEKTYYEIVQLFRDDKIESYELNLGSGLLNYKLRSDKTAHKYTVPSVSLFYEDVHAYVMRFNEEHPDSPVVFNYKSNEPEHYERIQPYHELRQSKGAQK